MSDPLQFVAPGDHRPLVYEGEIDAGGHWTDGVLRTENGDVSFPVEDGIPRFHLDNDGWDDEELRNRDLRKAGVEDPDAIIERNWDGMTGSDWVRKHEDQLRRVLETGGPIIEIAAGPGGGMTSMLLTLDPRASVVMNDIGLWPLRQWQRLARRKGCWPNLRFAQFDATRMPITSNSIPVVVSWGGISNVHRSDRALREVLRILRRGGRFFGIESQCSIQVTAQSLPEALDAFHAEFPSEKTDFQALLASIGFSPINVSYESERPVIPGEGGLADFAEKYKVDARLRFYRIEAVKP